MNNFDAPQAYQEDKGEGRLGWRKYAAVGSVVVALAFGIWKYLDQSGEIEGYTPDKPVPAAIDNELSVGSWNMRHETAERVGQIAKVIKHGKLDVMALQEVSGNDLDDLAERFPGWHVRSVVTDLAARPLEGGGHNVFMSRQSPKDVETRSLEGTSVLSSIAGVITGLGVDVANADTSFEETKSGRQEERAAIAMTIKVRQGEDLRELDIITSHISGEPRVHEDQREKLMDFIDDNRDKGRPAIFCGDLNSGPDEVIPDMAELGFITPQTGRTATGNKTIDYCSYYEADILGLGDVAVLPNPKTDHYPIIASWKIPKDR